MKPKQESPEIPSWIFFALYYAMEPKSQWGGEKQKLAERLVTMLHIRAGELALPDSVLVKLFEFNDFDDVSMYSKKEAKTQLQDKQKK
jgi:hypothetical protein